MPLNAAIDGSGPSRPTTPGAGDYWKTRYREGDEIIEEVMPRELKLGLSGKAR